MAWDMKGIDWTSVPGFDRRDFQIPETYFYDIGKVIIPGGTVDERVLTMSRQINTDFREGMMMIPVLDGAIHFLDRLASSPFLEMPVVVNSILARKQYEGEGDARQYKGVDVLAHKEMDLSGLDVLVVEDFIDTGELIYGVLGYLSALSPRSLSVATLLNRPDRRDDIRFVRRDLKEPGKDNRIEQVGAEGVVNSIPLKHLYTGFTVGGDDFLVGYGLGHNGRYANVPHIASLRPVAYG